MTTAARRRRPTAEHVTGSGEVVERRLTDGTCHRFIKVARGPGELVGLLTGLGWQEASWPSGPDRLLGEARPAGQ